MAMMTDCSYHHRILSSTGKATTECFKMVICHEWESATSEGKPSLKNLSCCWLLVGQLTIWLITAQEQTSIERYSPSSSSALTALLSLASFPQFASRGRRVTSVAPADADHWMLRSKFRTTWCQMTKCHPNSLKFSSVRATPLLLAICNSAGSNSTFPETVPSNWQRAMPTTCHTWFPYNCWISMHSELTLSMTY